jgi:hypothetical protein
MRSLLFKFCLRRGVKISSLEISGNEAVDNIVNVRLFKGISTAGSIKSDSGRDGVNGSFAEKEDFLLRKIEKYYLHNGGSVSTGSYG